MSKFVFELPKNYKYVLLTASLLGFQCMFTGFAVMHRARGKVYTKEYLEENFGEEHRRLGLKIPAHGYPDVGTGRFSEKLDLKQWYTINNAFRSQMNFVEHLVSVMPWVLISGLRYPLLASALGVAYGAGRVLYTVGYNTGGPDARESGAILQDLGALGLFGASVVAALSL